MEPFVLAKIISYLGRDFISAHSISKISSKKKFKGKDEEGEENKKKSSKPSKGKEVKTRRHYTPEEKAQIIGCIQTDIEKEKLEKGSEENNVSTICANHGIHYTRYFSW